MSEQDDDLADGAADDTIYDDFEDDFGDGEIELEPDSYGCNIYLHEPDIDTDNAVTFYEFIARRPVTAMLAAVYNDYIHGFWDVDYESYGLVAHNFHNHKGLQIVPNPDITPDEKEKLDNFLELVEEVAEDFNGLEYNPETMEVAARTERILLSFLEAFADSAELDLEPPDVADPEKHHAEYGGDDEASWQEYAATSLQEAWIFAAMPERNYISHDHLLREAYHRAYTMPYDFKRIEAMISQNEAAQHGQARAEPEPGGRAFVFYRH